MSHKLCIRAIRWCKFMDKVSTAIPVDSWDLLGKTGYTWSIQELSRNYLQNPWGFSWSYYIHRLAPWYWLRVLGPSFSHAFCGESCLQLLTIWQWRTEKDSNRNEKTADFGRRHSSETKTTLLRVLGEVYCVTKLQVPFWNWGEVMWLRFKSPQSLILKLRISRNKFRMDFSSCPLPPSNRPTLQILLPIHHPQKINKKKVTHTKTSLTHWPAHPWTSGFFSPCCVLWLCVPPVTLKWRPFQVRHHGWNIGPHRSTGSGVHSSGPTTVTDRKNEYLASIVWHYMNIISWPLYKV